MSRDEAIASLLKIERGAARVLPPAEQVIGPDDGEEIAAAYIRWRRQLIELASDAGWPLEMVRREVVDLDERYTSRYAGDGTVSRKEMAAAGRRAAVLIRVLLGWVEGQREALERLPRATPPHERPSSSSEDIGRYRM